MAWHSDTGNTLRYAERFKNTWLIATVDATDDPGSGCSLAFSASGNPVISYIRYTTSALHMAVFSGGQWHTSLVSQHPYSAWDSSLCILPSGQPAIAFYDLQAGVLRHAVRTVPLP